MIVSGLKIKEEVKNKNITIIPFDEKLLNPNSYNYRLSNVLYEVTDKIIDPKVKTSYKKIIIPETGYVLKPNKLYLGATFEEIGSTKYVTQLIGRSSVGRLGLFLQVTAPMGNLGCGGCWTLELRVVQPLRVYPFMRIGQVTFWNIMGDTSLNYLHGKYSNQKTVKVSKFYEKGGLL